MCQVRLNKFVVFVLLIFTASALRSQQGCGLDSRNRRNVTLPVIATDIMPSALAAEIRRGFDLIAINNQADAGELALQHARMSTNDCARALALYGLADAESTEHVDKALALFRESAVLLERVGTPLAVAHVHARIAAAQYVQGDSAAFLQEISGVQKEFHDAGDEAGAIQYEALAFQYDGQAQHADQQKALLERLKSVQSDNLVAVRGYLEWETGFALRRTGNFSEILGYFRAALADLTECDCEPSTHGAILLNFASASDSTSDAEAVLDYARKAEAIDRKFHLDTQLPQSLRLIAAGYAHSGDLPRAIATGEAALKMARDHGVLSATITIGSELADYYGRAGQPAKGLALLAETAPRKPTPSQACDTQAERMSLEVQARIYADADKDGEAVFANCNTLLQSNVLAQMHAQFAGMQIQQGFYEGALTHAKEAVRRADMDRLRGEPTDRARRAFNEQKLPGYNALIEAFVHMNRPEDALLASEQFRARAFVDLANTSRTEAAPATALPSDAHPFALTMDDIRASLAPNHATLVSYWLSQEGELTTWVLAPGKPIFQSRQAIDRVQLVAMVRATLPADGVGTRRGVQLATRGGPTQSVALVANKKPWRDLYGILIAPVAAQLPTEDGSLLTIVPQGELFQLAFPALLDPAGRYLVERYALHTVPSAGVLQITARNDRAAAALPASYVLLANPASYPQVEGRELPPLPGTAAEVREISRQLAGEQVTLLEGRQAGINTLARSLPAATVVHFATHAVVRDNAPLTSFLALDSAQKGGLLTAAAVYQLHLNASLVVLSACSTGRGQVSGDGVAGLSRAFLYAGAASLVTTLWDVVDEPTAQLMPHLYRNLSRGETRSDALRHAQLTLIDDLRHHRVRVKTLAGTEISLPERPAYWAAFSLSGQP